MADFTSWNHETLAKFAADTNAELIRRNNQHADKVQAVIVTLMQNATGERPETRSERTT